MTACVCQVVAISLLVIVLSFLAGPSLSSLVDDAVEEPEYSVKLIDVVPCDPEHTDELMFLWQDVFVQRLSRSEYGLNAKLTYRGEIKKEDKWAMDMKIFWQNGNDPNTKSPIAEMVIPDMCGELLKNRTNTDHFFEFISGGLSRYCPIEPGEYELKNFICDTSNMKGVLRPGFWFIEMDEKINGKESSCNIVSMEVTEQK